MLKRISIISVVALMVFTGYVFGTRSVIRAEPGIQTGMQMQAAVPKSYGRLVGALPDSIGTGLVFEDTEGTIRFVSVTGMKEGELARYDETPIHGGIPRAYGRLVSAVVNHGNTGLVFEDEKGVIRFVTMAGVTEQELTRN
jgi:hypothetical protein